MLAFEKYEGAGNDFIITVRDKNHQPLSVNQIKWLCNRRLGVGADGYIEIILNKAVDFEMRYYNADGNIGSMCGNGARCALSMAYRNKLIKENSKFLASDGVHEGQIVNENRIKISILNVENIQIYGDSYFLNTGSPHFVKFVSDLDEFPVFEIGKKIRTDKKFSPGGTNVNFVEKKADNIYLRTFERGVEDETLSCGTGVTAVALVDLYKNKILGKNQTLSLRTRGGDLNVSAMQEEPGIFSQIFLEGPANFVFLGEVNI